MVHYSLPTSGCDADFERWGASAMGLLAATLHTVAHIAIFRFHVAFDRTVAHMGWR